MAFNDIIRKKLGAPAARGRVAVRVSKTTLILILSEDVSAELGNPLYVKVGVGSGSDSGKLLVRATPSKSDRSYTLSTPSASRSRYVTLSPRSVGKTVTTLTKTVDHAFTKDGLVIDIRDVLAQE